MNIPIVEQLWNPDTPIGSYITLTRSDIKKHSCILGSTKRRHSLGHYKRTSLPTFSSIPDNKTQFSMKIVLCTTNKKCIVSINNDMQEIIDEQLVTKQITVHIIDNWLHTYPQTKIYSKISSQETLKDLLQETEIPKQKIFNKSKVLRRSITFRQRSNK